MVEPTNTTPATTSPTSHANAHTFIDPIGGLFSFLGWLEAHWVILVVVAAFAILLIVIWWLISHVRIIRGKKQAVKHAVKSAIKDAEESGIQFKSLVTKGNQRRPKQAYGKCYLKGHASLFFVSLYPRRGWFKSWRKRLVLLAPHHVRDLHGRTLEVDALGLSRHGLLSWPDDDLQNEEARRTWETLLLKSHHKRHAGGSYQPGMAYLMADIYDWFFEAFGVEVAAQQRLKGLDIMFDNMAAGMSENLLKKRGAGIDGLFEVADHDEGANDNAQGQEAQGAEPVAR